MDSFNNWNILNHNIPLSLVDSYHVLNESLPQKVLTIPSFKYSLIIISTTYSRYCYYHKEKAVLIISINQLRI